MSETRCCGKCRTPWDICGNKSCKCHGSALSEGDSGLPGGALMAYEYKGTKSGDADPWAAPKREPKPKPVKRMPQRTRKNLVPCGTKAAHKRHIYNGETPCDPCREAKRDYDRIWRAGMSA